MITKDFDSTIMIRATWQDVDRIMCQLWGSGARAQYRMIAMVEDGEILDLTQTPREILLENTRNEKDTAYTK